MPEPSAYTLDVDGARVAYDVRGDLHAGTPLFLIGSPMDAGGFMTLAGHFADRPVITYDPRGTGRSVRTATAPQSTPEDHARDLRAVIDALGVDGLVDMFATSGGAINALALVTAHPDRLRTLVAHEPPVADAVPDREQVLAVVADMYDTYERRGSGPAMAKFIAFVGRQGPLPDTFTAEPQPDPAMFGLPSEDDGRRDDPLLAQNLRSSVGYLPDYDALAAAPTRVVLAAGRDSAGQLAARAAAGIAERLGTPLVEFPSHHAGFLGGEYGQRGEPDAFAARLREVLDES